MLTKKIENLNNCFFKGEILYEENLSRHTTLKIGGIAPIWFSPFNLDDLFKFLEYCDINNFKIIVLGNGSNVVVNDNKLDMVFLNLSCPYFKKIKVENKKIVVGAGANLMDVINYAKKSGLSGLEYFTLIPATIGGAVVTDVSVNFNGKVYKFLDLVSKIKILEVKTNEIKTISINKTNSENIKFKNKILIEAELDLTHDKCNSITKRIKNVESYRIRTQDYVLPSCGCVFKNPLGKKITAGEMIQESGLKGKKIGDAMISSKHANFIVNCGKASYKDISDLIKLVKEEVFKNYKVSLKEEIEIIG